MSRVVMRGFGWSDDSVQNGSVMVSRSVVAWLVAGWRGGSLRNETGGHETGGHETSVGVVWTVHVSHWSVEMIRPVRVSNVGE